jgi:hypothetical protein
MLIFRDGTWPEHCPWVWCTGGLTVAAVIWYVAEGFRAGQWPGGSSLPEFVFGVAGGLIVVFELLLGVRKNLRSVRIVPFRTNRWITALVWLCLFSVTLLVLYRGFRAVGLTLGGVLIVAFMLQFGAKHWMRAHIWLGLFSVPLLLLHSGFHFWNLSLSGVLMAVFLLTFASGLWGLILQQRIPSTMLDEIPAEQIHSQIDRRLEQFLDEARRLVDITCSQEEGGAYPANGDSDMGVRRLLVVGAIRPAGHVQNLGLQARPTAVPVPGSEPLRRFFERYVDPFLRRRNVDRLPLAWSERSAALFRDLKTRLDPATHGIVATLEDMCNQRRQLAKQVLFHNRLHRWLCVHLPLSIALVILMIIHITYALLYF